MQLRMAAARTRPLQISGAPVTVATQNVAYAGFSASASGGSGGYVYSIQSGALPTGITLNSSTGVVSGTPTGSGASPGIVIRVTDSYGHTADLASFSITVSAATKLAPGGSWTGTQNSGFGGAAPSDPTRTTAKPTNRPLWPDHMVTFNDYTFVVDAGAKGGIATVTFTLEGGTPVVATTPQLVTYSDANGVSRTVYGYAAQIDNAATVAQAASGVATLSIEVTPSDGAMQSRVMNYSIYPRSTEFTDTVTVGAGGNTYTTLKQALLFAAANGPGSGSPKRVKIVCTDNADYDIDGLDPAYTTASWWTVITHSPGVTATMGNGTRAQTFAGFGSLCFRGSGIVFDIAKLGYTMKSWRFTDGGSRLWLDACEVKCSAPNTAQGGGGAGAGAVFRGAEPNQFWINGNDSAASFEIYYTEVNAHDVPAYGLSFHRLRRNSSMVMCGGSDDENSYCTHGGYSDKIGGYWSGQRTYQGAFDITYTGGATLAQFDKPTQCGYTGNFNLYEDSATPTYSFLTKNDPTDSAWTSMQDLIDWINSKTGWHATATSSTTALGASYVQLNGVLPTSPLPKTTASATAVSVKRIADVHADVSVWTAPGAPLTVENVSKRFFENRRNVGTDLISVPDGNVTAKDWCLRNFSNQDISSTVGASTQPGVWGANNQHVVIQYVSDTSPSGNILDGPYDSYCVVDRYAGKISWGVTPNPNLTLSNIFAQQPLAPTYSDANSKASDVASSTLYVDWTANPPNFAPITAGAPPLFLADLTFAGRYAAAGTEQGT
jgi:hypothetical protein